MKHKQTEKELDLHLKEQIQFLLKSAKSYDEGFFGEAKRLATVIRVLLHDTQNSTSLLTLLKKKDILFYATAIGDKNSGLTMIKMNSEGVSFVPVLDNGPPYRYTKGKISFEEWWNETVLVDEKGNEFNRKKLILEVANTNGGTHIDSRLDEAYAGLTRFNSSAWKTDSKTKLVVDVVPSNIRQIAHEVLKSLKDEFPQYFI